MAVWAVKAARPPLVVLACMGFLFVIWLARFSPSQSAPAPAAVLPTPIPGESSKTVVVRGQLGPGFSSSGDSSPITVHLSLPELAYQVDAVVDPDGDGAFSLPLKVGGARPELHYTLELSQGEQRRTLSSDRTLSTAASEIDLGPVAVTSERPPDRRAHLESPEEPDVAPAEALAAAHSERREKALVLAKAQAERRQRK